MRACCSPGHGCNSPHGTEACALELLSATAEELEESALALSRWQVFQRAREQHCTARERRFHRRAYERVRDEALIAIAIRHADLGDVPGPEKGVTRQAA